MKLKEVHTSGSNTSSSFLTVVQPSSGSSTPRTSNKGSMAMAKHRAAAFIYRHILMKNLANPSKVGHKRHQTARRPHASSSPTDKGLTFPGRNRKQTKEFFAIRTTEHNLLGAHRTQDQGGRFPNAIADHYEINHNLTDSSPGRSCCTNKSNVFTVNYGQTQQSRQLSNIHHTMSNHLMHEHIPITLFL